MEVHMLATLIRYFWLDAFKVFPETGNNKKMGTKTLVPSVPKRVFDMVTKFCN